MKKKYIIFSMFLLISYNLFSQQTIGVLDITPRQGVSEQEAEIVTDFVFAALYQYGSDKYSIISRQNREKILTEHAFLYSGFSDDTSSALEAGKYLSADYVVIGTFTKFGSRYYISLQLVDVNTTKVIGSAREGADNLDVIASTAIEICVAGLFGESFKSVENPSYTDTEKITMSLGLVAYYPFKGNANDESGNRNHGVIYGVTLTEDRFGNQNSAYHFDGVNDKIITNEKNFAANNNLTVSLWLKPNPNNRNLYCIMCSDFGIFNYRNEVGIAISLPDTNNAAANINNTGQWIHFVGTYDGRFIKAYINGKFVNQQRHSGNLSDPNMPLTFGYFHREFWAGQLDDIRIYNRVLSESEVSQLFEIER